MPEHLPDPIDRLRSLRNGGIAVSPLPPEEVRRLGARRRSRRHVGIAVASGALVLAAVVPAALIATRDNSNGTPPVGPVDNPTATVTAEAPQDITYPDPGVEVVVPADTAKLEGTTREFKVFIGQLSKELGVEGASCPDAFHGVTVQKYSSAGYAVGGVNACGGNVALWAKPDVEWRQVIGTQEAFDCDALRYYAIPESFVGDCYDYKGEFGPTTDGSLRLGMTEAQIKDSGGSVVHTSGVECQSVHLADPPRVPDQADGWYSPVRGLLAVFAQPGTKTPKGIGPGSTMAEVRAAYPDLHQVQRGPDKVWVVPIDTSSEYEFSFKINETVDVLVLARPDQDCYMWH